MCRIVTFTGPIGVPEREIALAGDLTIHEALVELEARYPALFCEAKPGTPGAGVHPAGKRFHMPTVALVGGEPVLQGQWHVRRLKADETLALVAVPRGGGGGGNTGKQVASAVAMLAVAIAAPYAGPAIATAMGFSSTLAANVATAAFALAGSALVSAVLRPPSQTPQGGEPVYGVTAGSNRMLPLQPRWVLYGKLRYAAPFAARPWSSYEGNDQYLHQLLWITEGEAVVEAIEFGDTPSSSFADIETEVVAPGVAVTLFPTSMVTSDEVAGLEISDTANTVLGPYTINAAGTQIKRVHFDIAFQEGLFRKSSKGVTGVAGRLIKFEVREIDDSGVAVGVWTTLETYNFSAATETPQRFSRSYALTAGRYEARVTPTDPGNLERVWNSATWIGLRGNVTGDEPTPSGTRLAIRIRANEQLSAVVSNQINVTATRKLPTYSGGVWSAPVATRSIVWAVADMLRNADYSAGYADTDFDLSWLVTYATVFSGRGDNFDAMFDRGWVLRDAISAALRCGRSQMIRLGDKIGFTRYEAKSIRRAHFTARDIVKGSFEENPIAFSPDLPDSIIAKYIDARTWRDDEVKATVAAIGGDKPVERDYFGITDRDHAWREAVTDAAVNAYCRRPVKFTTEWSGKILTRGEPILVSHPLLAAVGSAGIVSVSGATVTLDHDATSAIEGSATQLYVRGKKGKEWGPCLISSMPDGVTVVLDAGDLAAVEAEDGTLASVLPGANARKRAVAVLANADAQPFPALVQSVKPSGPHRVTIEAVNDAAEPYTADGTETIPPEYLLPTLVAVPGVPVAPTVYAYATNALLEIKLVVGWAALPGALSYVAQVRYGATGNWKTIFSGGGLGTEHFFPPMEEEGGTDPSLFVRVRGIGSVDPGPWTTKEIPPESIPDPTLAPAEIVSIENMVKEAQERFEQLDKDSQASLATALDDVRSKIREVANLAASGIAREMNEKRKIVRHTEDRYDEARAAITLVEEVAASDREALASQITVLQAEIDAADLAGLASAVDAVEVRVTQTESGIDLLATDQEALILELYGPGGTIGTASRIDSAEVTISQHGSDISLNASDIDAVQAELPNKASVSALNTQIARIDANESDITVHGSDLTGIKGEVYVNGDPVQGSVIDGMQVDITAHDGVITDIQAQRFIAVNANGTLAGMWIGADGTTDTSIITLSATRIVLDGEVVFTQNIRATAVQDPKFSSFEGPAIEIPAGTHNWFRGSWTTVASFNIDVSSETKYVEVRWFVHFIDSTTPQQGQSSGNKTDFRIRINGTVLWSDTTGVVHYGDPIEYRFNGFDAMSSVAAGAATVEIQIQNSQTGVGGTSPPQGDWVSLRLFGIAPKR